MAKRKAKAGRSARAAVVADRATVKSEAKTHDIEERPPPEPSIPEPTPPFYKAHTWLDSKQKWIVAAIVVMSLCIRVVYFIQINSGPCSNAHHWSQSDMSFYHDWGVRIAEGDWLTDRPSHRYTDYEKRLATRYFQLYPERKADYADDEDPARAFITTWWQGKLFRTEPLYPYLIGVTYRLFGVDVRYVFMWQILLGVATNVLIYLIARSCFGSVAGVISAILAIFYGPFLFYEMVLIRATLIKFGVALTLYFVIWASRAKTRLLWFVTGIAFGMGFLIKTIFKVLFASTVCCLAARHFREPKSLANSIGPLVAGVLLALSPLVYRNLMLGNPILSIAATERYTFFLAHSVEYNPKYNTIPHVDQIVRFLGESGEGTISAVKYTLNTHDSVASYFKLIWAKFMALLYWYEWPNNANFYYYQLRSSILDMLPFTFALVGPISLVGMVVALPRIRNAWLLYNFAVTQILIFLVARVNARYKMPLMVALIPFAAILILLIAQWLSKRRRGPLAAALATTLATVLLSIWILRPLPDGIRLIRSPDYFSVYEWYAKTGGPSVAREYLEELVGLGIEDKTVFLKLGVMAMEREDYPLSEKMLKRSLELDSSYAPALKNLGVVSIQTGQLDAAKTHYLKAIDVDPNDPATYTNLLAVYLSQNDLKPAVKIARKALKRFPDDVNLSQNAVAVLEAAKKPIPKVK